MKRINYPKFMVHKSEHTKFIREVEELKRTFDSGANINAVQVGKMLSDWLRNHIKTVDVELSAALQQAK